MNYEKLTQAGMDMDSFLKRIMGNTALVRILIQKFTEDKNFEALTAAFASGDMQAAELASHTLKGMCGNLSLQQLYGLFSEQTDHIRRGEYEEAREMMSALTPAYGRTIEGMKAFLAKA